MECYNVMCLVYCLKEFERVIHDKMPPGASKGRQRREKRQAVRVCFGVFPSLLARLKAPGLG